MSCLEARKKEEGDTGGLSAEKNIYPGCGIAVGLAAGKSYVCAPAPNSENCCRRNSGIENGAAGGAAPAVSPVSDWRGLSLRPLQLLPDLSRRSKLLREVTSQEQISAGMRICYLDGGPFAPTSRFSFSPFSFWTFGLSRFFLVSLFHLCTFDQWYELKTAISMRRCDSCSYLLSA